MRSQLTSGSYDKNSSSDPVHPNVAISTKQKENSSCVCDKVWKTFADVSCSKWTVQRHSVDVTILSVLMASVVHSVCMSLP